MGNQIESGSQSGAATGSESWIPVIKCRPETSCPVRVKTNYWGNREEHTATFKDGKWMLWCPEKTPCELKFVTHWQPIIAPILTQAWIDEERMAWAQEIGADPQKPWLTSKWWPGKHDYLVDSQNVTTQAPL